MHPISCLFPFFNRQSTHTHTHTHTLVHVHGFFLTDPSFFLKRSLNSTYRQRSFTEAAALVGYNPGVEEGESVRMTSISEAGDAANNSERIEREREREVEIEEIEGSLVACIRNIFFLS